MGNMSKLFLFIPDIPNASKAAKPLLIVTAVLLIISLAGVITSRALLPDEIEQETTLVNYEHTGTFDYLIHLKPSYLFGPIPVEPPPELPNPKYPREIIKQFDMKFIYIPETEENERVKITAVLENPDVWQKEIILVPQKVKAGRFSIHFLFDIGDIDEKFDTIDDEIDITSSERKVTIIADVRNEHHEVFTLSLPIDLGKTLIEVDGNLTKTQSGATGKFDYTIHLEENSLFDSEILKPPPVPAPQPPPLTKTVGPGELIFARLIEEMDVTFYYSLTADQPINDVTTDVKLTASLEAVELWSKEFPLLRVSEKKDVKISFPLDVVGYLELADTIRAETGVPAKSYSVNVTADVYTVAETHFGTIDETFSQVLNGVLIGNVLEWNEELTQTEPGSIKTTQMIPNPNRYLGLSVSGARDLSTILASVFGFFFLLSVVVYVRFKPAELPYVEKEARRARKKYGERMAEAISQTPIEGEKIISLTSMEDLIKIADELGKPIVHQPPSTREQPHAYYVFDGATRYQYLLTPGSEE